MPLTSGVPGPGKQPTPRAVRQEGSPRRDAGRRPARLCEKQLAGHVFSVAPQAGALQRGSPAPWTTRRPRRLPSRDRADDVPGHRITLDRCPPPSAWSSRGALLLAAAVLLTIAVLGALGRLRRNPWAGVRTRGTLASDEAFTRRRTGWPPPRWGPPGSWRCSAGSRWSSAGQARWSGRCSWSRRRACWGSPGSGARSATGPRRGWTLRRRAARGRAQAATSWPAAALPRRPTGPAPPSYAAGPPARLSERGSARVERRHAARDRASERSVVPGVERERRQQRQRDPLAAQHP